MDIDKVVSLLERDYAKSQILNEFDASKEIKRDDVIYMLKLMFALVLPHFGREEGDTRSMVCELYGLLSSEISKVLPLVDKNLDAGKAKMNGDRIAEAFFLSLPSVRELIEDDLDAFYENDPASFSKGEIIIAYPGFRAIMVYRLAHILYENGVPVMPRVMSEYAHSRTGIDIHPGTKIGRHFFIDHGTGVVIGETAVIGDNVKIYQGVTIGALSTKGGQSQRGVKRHPTICDNVTIYSGATILGGDTVVGRNAVIGGNAFITYSVPENKKAF